MNTQAYVAMMTLDSDQDPDEDILFAKLQQIVKHAIDCVGYTDRAMVITHWSVDRSVNDQTNGKYVYAQDESTVRSNVRLERTTRDGKDFGYSVATAITVVGGKELVVDLDFDNIHIVRRGSTRHVQMTSDPVTERIARLLIRQAWGND